MKKQILIIMLLLSLILAACQSAATEQPTEAAVPTEEPMQATDTLVPTEVPPTETPTSTPEGQSSGDPAVILGEPDGVDTFDDAGNWTLFDNECFKSEITDGSSQIGSIGNLWCI